MKVLFIGKVCLDVVNYLDEYPSEDTDNVIKYQRWSQGGNAANSCVVISRLKLVLCEENEKELDVELFASFGTDLASNYVRHLLKNKYNMKMEKCPIRRTGESGGVLGTTCIMVNGSNGSRTLVHAVNDVDEVNYDDFLRARFDLAQYDWVHVETRSPMDSRKILDSILSWKTKCNAMKPAVSIELEKNKSGCECLFVPGIDYFFVGKDFAKGRNLENMEDTARYMAQQLDPNATVVCPWAELGACVVEKGQSFSCPAYSSKPVIDTLGAGDTFFASFIFAKCRLRLSAQDATKLACLVAGVKCGTVGYDDIGTVLKEIMDEKGDGYLTGWCP